MKQDKSKKIEEAHEIPNVEGGEAATIGRRFSREREKLRLTIDDVAKSMRMRPDVIRELERDDLSSFNNAAYARLTLLGYARFLNIAEAEVKPWLPEAGGFSLEAHTYLDHYSVVLKQGKHGDMEVPKKNRSNPFVRLFKMLVFLFFVLLVLAAYLLYTKVERIQVGKKPMTKGETAAVLSEGKAVGEGGQAGKPVMDTVSAAASVVAAPTTIPVAPAAVAPAEPEVIVPAPASTPVLAPTPIPAASPVSTVRSAQPVKSPSGGR